MQTTKPINPGQLNSEALAVAGGRHVELTLIGAASDATGICSADGDLMCSDVAGSSDIQEPCAAAMTAYNAHVAAANAATKNQLLVGMGSEMSNWSSANPSGTAAALAQHMSQWAAAHA